MISRNKVSHRYLRGFGKLSSLGLDEAWLQKQIWNNPSSIGPEDLVGVTKERLTNSGGWLDLLLNSPVDDSMFEVEVMLDDTDPSHISFVLFVSSVVTPSVVQPVEIRHLHRPA